MYSLIQYVTPGALGSDRTNLVYCLKGITITMDAPLDTNSVTGMSL